MCECAPLSRMFELTRDALPLAMIANWRSGPSLADGVIDYKCDVSLLWQVQR